MEVRSVLVSLCCLCMCWKCLSSSLAPGKWDACSFLLHRSKENFHCYGWSCQFSLWKNSGYYWKHYRKCTFIVGSNSFHSEYDPGNCGWCQVNQFSFVWQEWGWNREATGVWIAQVYEWGWVWWQLPNPNLLPGSGPPSWISAFLRQWYCWLQAQADPLGWQRRALGKGNKRSLLLRRPPKIQTYLQDSLYGTWWMCCTSGYVFASVLGKLASLTG